MKLFDLFATLSLDTGSFAKGLNAAKNMAVKTVTATAKAMGAGFGLAATGMVAMTKQAVDAFGELEQNLGGSEAVFKEYAEAVQDAGRTAFETMGLSQSDFLATANKMGSLMQGSGIDIQKSMDLTTKAMQRAADVASIMGIDTAWAMESIAGAAKGNFTMMDNLGVAMNATTLEAYALSKGIDTAWESMENSTKIMLAMEMFLERTAYAAGNYARENETLAGSLTTVKAAYKNFLSGAGTAQELSKALSRYGKVLSQNMKVILPGLVEGVNSIITSFVPELPTLMNEMLPGIIQGAGNLLSGVALALPNMVNVIIDQLPKIMKNLAYSAERVWNRGVWPYVQDLFKIAFDVELPKWHKFKLNLRLWADENIAPAVENVKSFFADLFNFVNEHQEDVSALLVSIGSAVLALKLAVNPTALALDALIAAIVLVITNWESVKNAVTDAVNAVGNFFTQTIPGTWTAMVESVRTWINDTFVAPFQNAINKLKEFFGLNAPDDEPITVKDAMKAGMSAEKIQLGLTSGDIVPYANSHGGGKINGFATGLYNVPFDNFLARLHEGEAVLTKAEAENWRKDRNSTVTRSEFYALVDAIDNLASRDVVMYADNDKLAEASYRKTQRMLDRHNHETIIALGG